MNRTKRIPALLLAAAVLCSLLPPAAAAANQVTIRDLSGFLDFARSCTKDTWSVGLTVELAADLDLKGADFSPIPIFQGTFHGNGHTISGLSFQDKGSRVGLFRTLTDTAVVEDLTVEGTLQPGGTAGQVGLVAGENHGTVLGCTAQGTVSGQEDVGGVVGLNGESGTVEGCANHAAVSAPLNAGGVAGQNLGTLSACANSGTVNIDPYQEAPSNSGGIAGLSRGTITSCTNTGAVGYQHLGYNVGGIAGLQSGTILTCSNTGAILGRKDVGGIVGQFEPSVEVRYGTSPADALNSSLSTLFAGMEDFSSQLNAMAGRGLEDAQVIQDALGQIRDRTQAAGSEGLEDYRAMTDQLDQDVVALGQALDRLRARVDQFSDIAGNQLDILLDETARFRRSLNQWMDSADSAFTQAVDALDVTAGRIDSQVRQIQRQLQAMSNELDNLKRYLEQLSDCLVRLDLEGALALTFPTLDPAGHLSAIRDLLAGLPGLVSDLTSRWNQLSQQVSQEMGAARDQANQAADAIHAASSILVEAGGALSDGAQQELDAVSAQSDAIRALLKNYSDTLGDKAQAAAEDIGDQLDVVQDRVAQMTQAAGADNAALHAAAQRVTAALDQVRQAIYELGQEPELTTSDLSQDLTQGPGLVSGCTAACTVEGDSNVGGIVGAVGAEVGDDPEATFDVGNLKLLADVYATLRAAVRDCRFDGGVTVKNDCGGGIAGRCTVGALVDCAARGTVETGTDYCGGIVGRTNGTVVRCAALTDLTGGSWLGGVAGLGGTLTDCRAMVRAQGEGEYRGAVAGQADGTLSGNRYLLEELAGLDGVDLTGQAEGLDFAAFSQLDHLPVDFLTFSYRFIVDGQTVAEIPFSYGADLDQTLVPDPPVRDGTYGEWPDFPVQGLTRSMVLEAQFTQPTATLSSGGEFPTLLAQGSFDPQAMLTLEDRSDLPALPGYQSLGSWSYTITGGETDTVTLRLRAAEAVRPAAAIQDGDGNWQVMEAQQDGSYLVFEAPASGQLLLLDQPTPNLVPIVLGVCIGLLALAAVLLLLRRHRKKPSKPAPSPVN